MSTITKQGQYSLRCLDQRQVDPFLIEKKKILIGSDERSDFRIQDKSVSSLHAFLCVWPEGLMVKNLFSEYGIFLNGKRVEEAFLTSGDVLTIGTLSFAVEELEAERELLNPDESLTPAMKMVASIDLPAREGLVFIDGEYCDIQFDDSVYQPLKEPPKVLFEGGHVELEETQEALDIIHTVKARKLEVISYMNGMMMDMDYLELKDGEYSLSPVKQSPSDIVFHTLSRRKIFSVEQGQLRFYPQDSLSPSMPWEKISLGEVLFLTHGAEQISLRLVEKSVRWKGLPLFYRDRSFYQQTGKVFATVFLPLLLLLFVTIPPKEVEQTEVAVVYKLPDPLKKSTDSQEKSELKAQEVTSRTENTGHKENQQDSSRVEFAAASQKQKNQAKSSSPQQPSAVSAPAVKAYEFKSSVAMNALVGDSPKINTQGAGSTSGLAAESFNTGSADDGKLVATANIGVSKFNGADSKGTGAGSYGSRGLATKSGFDSAYMEPKTVVLGSMDPELLRKILREYIPQFRHCYQAELVGHSDKIRGIIDLHFTISPEGRVAKHDIRAKDARFSKKGLGCMGQVLGLIEFPRPKGGGVVDVRQPLNFFAETEKI